MFIEWSILAPFILEPSLILPSMPVQYALSIPIYMSVCELPFLCATGILRKDNHPNLNTLPRKAVWRDIIMFERTMGRI